MPTKRRTPGADASTTTPKARQSKLAKEHNITPQQENEIKEAFALFSRPQDGEKDGVIPTGDVRKAMMYVNSSAAESRTMLRIDYFRALGIPPLPIELPEFLSILDPDEEGFAVYSSFVAICALKLHAKADDSGAQDEEVEAAFRLFTNGTDGPIQISHLKRVAASLKEDVSEDLLKDMILEANGGGGLGKGVQREEFAMVMRRAGVWK
jgi:hydroxyacylglutathione hydrolase